MKIQRRLTLGIGILFAMIVLLGIQSVSYVRQLSRATGTILADNYNSLQYAADMLRSLNDIGEDSVSRHALRQSLALQQQNITEISEREMTSELGRHIAALSDPVTEAELRTVRQDLLRIMELNMAAIRAKSSAVEERADYVMWWLIVVAALCVVSAGAILVWFPRLVLRPIDELKKGIREIANHNYQQRLDFTGNREFESVAESFNDMAAKLDEYRRSSLDDLMTAKKRIEAIVDTLHEPIIGLGPDRKILFMNREALAVLNLQAEVVGRNAAEVALSNDLLRRLMRELYGEKRSTGGEPLKIYADNKESYFQMENTPLYITPVGGREQQFVGNLIILSNVTKYKELDSAKTNFISTVSHEMKTPISSILMSLQLLGDDRLGKLNDEQKQLVGSIRDSSDRLLSITGELLRQAQTHAQDHQADRTDRLRRQGDAGIGRAVLLFRRGGIPRKNLETVRRQRKDRVGHHQPAVERHPPLARKIAHHRGRRTARKGGRNLRAGFRTGHRPALPQEHFRTLFPRTGHQGTGQRIGAGHLQGVRRGARRHDRRRKRDRQGQPLLDPAARVNSARTYRGRTPHPGPSADVEIAIIRYCVSDGISSALRLEKGYFEHANMQSVKRG